MSATTAGILQLVLVAALAAVHAPLGAYMARVYTSPKHLRVERGFYRVVRVDPDAEQRWTTYLLSLLGFSLVSVLFLYGMLRLQRTCRSRSGWNPRRRLEHRGLVRHEHQLAVVLGRGRPGHLVQMAGFAVQNFVSAAVGMAVAIALVRGFARSGTDRARQLLGRPDPRRRRILLPLRSSARSCSLPRRDPEPGPRTPTLTTLDGATQYVAGGPIASQEAIKELGTNGGGLFNANSAHPFENPTPFTNILEIFLLLVIPFALPRTFGIMVGDKRQGWAILAVMAGLWAASLVADHLGRDGRPGRGPAGGRRRHGGQGDPVRRSPRPPCSRSRRRRRRPARSTRCTTRSLRGRRRAAVQHAARRGGAGRCRRRPVRHADPGRGRGVHRRSDGRPHARVPGQEDRPARDDDRRAVRADGAALVLVMARHRRVVEPGRRSWSPAPHGLSEVLYAYTSAANNNGSAFAGLTAGTPFYKVGAGLAMLLGRFVPIALVLALAGRWPSRRRCPRRRAPCRRTARCSSACSRRRWSSSPASRSSPLSLSVRSWSPCHDHRHA